MLPNKITKENFLKNPSVLLHVYYVYINTANPVVYVVQYIKICSSGTVGCLRTNNKSKLNSLRCNTNWFQGLSCCTSNKCYISGFFVYSLERMGGVSDQSNC